MPRAAKGEPVENDERVPMNSGAGFEAGADADAEESLVDMFARLSCGEESEIPIFRDQSDYGRELPDLF